MAAAAAAADSEVRRRLKGALDVVFKTGKNGSFPTYIFIYTCLISPSLIATLLL